MNDERFAMSFAGQRGGALLAVLWLSAALAAVAFALATSVRGETERASTAADGVRAYFLATGAVERALLYMAWGPEYRNPDGTSRYYTPGQSVLHLPFPSGVARVDIIPETAKLNINQIAPDELFRLLANLGAHPEAARQLTLAIVDWRQPAPAGSLFDQFYLSRVPSFLARHASFEETEELLLVHGMNPELFYGRVERGPDGRLIPVPGLRDCVSPYGSTSQVDVNTAELPVLLTVGLPPDVAMALVERRKVMPIRTPQEFQQLVGSIPGSHRLRLGGNTIYTLRSTAALRLPNGPLSDLRRTVAAQVKFQMMGVTPPYVVLRWYDQAGAMTSPGPMLP